MKRFIILCAILALTLLVAHARPAAASNSVSFHAGLEDDFENDGGGRTARSHFFDHGYTAPARENGRGWHARTDPGVFAKDDGVHFVYQDRDYEEVWLITDADDWEQTRMALDAGSGLWEVTVHPDAGRLDYQFRVRRQDGTIRDRTDPTNPTRRRHPEQGWVSRVEITSDGEVVFRDRDRRHEEDYLDEYDLSFFNGIGADYQRVDGFVLRASPSFASRNAWAPALYSTFGYGFSSERGTSRVTFLQPLVAGGQFRAVISGYEVSDYTDRTAVGDTENSLATLMFREDSRDWYRRKGISLGVELEQRHDLLVRAEFRSDEYTSMPRTVVAGWGGRGDFTVNPAIDEGIMRSILIRARWGDEYTHLWAQYENGDSSVFSSEQDFSQLILQGRMRWRIGWAQTLHLRAKWGTELSGALPVQKQFVAGGLGTVRGYAYQSLFDPKVAGQPAPYGGAQLGLFNAEYVLGFHDDLGISLFFDSGMVHEEPGGLRLGDFRSSIGLGLVVIDSGSSSLRLDFAQPLDDDGGLLVQGRLTRPF